MLTLFLSKVPRNTPRPLLILFNADKHTEQSIFILRKRKLIKPFRYIRNWLLRLLLRILLYFLLLGHFLHHLHQLQVILIQLHIFLILVSKGLKFIEHIHRLLVFLLHVPMLIVVLALALSSWLLRLVCSSLVLSGGPRLFSFVHLPNLGHVCLSICTITMSCFWAPSAWHL